MKRPSQTTSTAYAVANTQSQRFHCIYGVAAIFNCHTLCGYPPHAFGGDSGPCCPCIFPSMLTTIPRHTDHLVQSLFLSIYMSILTYSPPRSQDDFPIWSTHANEFSREDEDLFHSLKMKGIYGIWHTIKWVNKYVKCAIDCTEAKV